MKQWRAELVDKYGDGIVRAIESDAMEGVEWPCLDTMDGRQWCRIHDAPWPNWQPQPRGCDAWSASGSAVGEAESGGDERIRTAE